MPKVPARAAEPTRNVRPVRPTVPDPLWTQTTAGDPTQSNPVVPTALAPTVAVPFNEPVAYFTPVHQAPPQVVVPTPPTYFEEVVLPVEEDGLRAWMILTLVASVILAGIIGVLIGRASKQDPAASSSVAHPAQVPTTSIVGGLLQTTVAVVPTPAVPVSTTPAATTPAVTTPAATNDLQSQIAALTAARDQTAQQLQQSQQTVNSLQAALAQAQGASTAPQTANPAPAGQIAALQGQLADATQHAASLQDQLTQSTQSVAAAQAQLAAATRSLNELGVTTLANFVNGSVNDAQQQAGANGWTVVQQQVSNGSTPPGTIITQTPAPGSKMIKGSALYLQVAAAPAPTTTNAPATTPPKTSTTTTSAAPASTAP